MTERLGYEELLTIVAPQVGSVDLAAAEIAEMVELGMVTREIVDGQSFYFLTPKNVDVAIRAGVV